MVKYFIAFENLILISLRFAPSTRVRSSDQQLHHSSDFLLSISHLRFTHTQVTMATEPRSRSTTLNRDTAETQIKLSLNLDGGALPAIDEGAQTNGQHAVQSSKSQQISIDTGIGFLDHMLHALAKHGGWSLHLRTKGDLHIDDHHTAEDTFIALGQVSFFSSIYLNEQCDVLM